MRVRLRRVSHRRLILDGIDTSQARELDETSDEPWCYLRGRRRRG